MGISATRILATFRKELRDYRRNRFIVMTMAMLPVIFLAVPIADIFTVQVTVTTPRLGERIGISLLYMLLLPALIPAVMAAYSVIGEREQGTLEPVLTTPVRREEFLVGKALAVLVPALAIAYAVYGIFLLCVWFFANPVMASTILAGPRILVQLLFTPLLAGWSIWVGIAVSTRASDVRVAQQLGTFASLPPLAVVALMSFNVITPTFTLALILGAALLVIDVLGWMFVGVLFDRERLVASVRT